MAYEVSPLLIQYGSFSIACFCDFVIEESLEVGSWDCVVDKSVEGTASPGGVVDEFGNGSVSTGVVEEGEVTRELGDDTKYPTPLLTPFSNY